MVQLQFKCQWQKCVLLNVNEKWAIGRWIKGLAVTRHQLGLVSPSGPPPLIATSGMETPNHQSAIMSSPPVGPPSVRLPPPLPLPPPPPPCSSSVSLRPRYVQSECKQIGGLSWEFTIHRSFCPLHLTSRWCSLAFLDSDFCFCCCCH